MASADAHTTLGYWAIRGLAEPCRTLLEYLQVPYKQIIYHKEEEWVPVKETSTFLFPNLPYLEVEDKKTITESEAIWIRICELGNKVEMCGKEADRVEFSQIKNVVFDVQNGITDPSYTSKDVEELKKNVAEWISQGGSFKLKGLNEILGKREWLLSYLTFIDFHFAEICEKFADMDKELGTSILKDYPNIQAHTKRFIELPGVKAYRESDRFKARPYNNYQAVWK